MYIPDTCAKSNQIYLRFRLNIESLFYSNRSHNIIDKAQTFPTRNIVTKIKVVLSSGLEKGQNMESLSKVG